MKQDFTPPFPPKKKVKTKHLFLKHIMKCFRAYNKFGSLFLFCKCLPFIANSQSFKWPTVNKSVRTTGLRVDFVFLCSV